MSGAAVSSTGDVILRLGKAVWSGNSIMLTRLGYCFDMSLSSQGGLTGMHGYRQCRLGYRHVRVTRVEIFTAGLVTSVSTSTSGALIGNVILRYHFDM